MPKPQYPTPDGIWSRGRRKEASYERVRLGTPYQEAVENFRKATLDREDFDPAVLFVWGTMQAKAVLSILKAAEETFGEAGQKMVRKAIRAAGREAADGLLQNSEFPDDADDMELVSYIVTGINCVLYASLERPWIASDHRSEFDILWCPHQDTYTAFDCRVQRYFVEGMIEAVNARRKHSIVPKVEKLIPKGAECCHFVVDRVETDEDNNAWDQYSDQLARRALEKLAKEE